MLYLHDYLYKLIHFLELVFSDFYVRLGAYIFLAMVVLQSLRMIFKLVRNKAMGISTKPLSRPGNGKRVLFLGDSTAVGTGADRPEDSIAGRLAAEYPDADILNVAENGGLVRDLRGQIEGLSKREFDLIIVSVGGNDVWHLTSFRKIKKVLNEVLPLLNQMSHHRVLFLVYNNIGSAPVFPYLIRVFLKRRCTKLQNLIRSVANRCEVPTIDLFTEDEKNPFLASPEELFSLDGIHPSSKGYQLWYNRIWRIMHENGYRF